MQFLFLLLLALTFDQEWKYHFQGTQNKEPFEIILHDEWVTSTQSWVVKEIMSRSNPYEWMFNFLLSFQLRTLVIHPTFKIISNVFFCFVFPRSYVFISDQNVNAKSNRNRNCNFYDMTWFPWPASFEIISNGFLFCVPRKWYFHIWSKVKAKRKRKRKRNCIFWFPWES